MAYQMTVNTDSGLTVNNAYLRIVAVNGGKEAITAIVVAHINKEAVESGLAPIKETYFTFVPSVEKHAANFIQQAYDYGKTIEDYKEAIDV